jgi:hypothetical protein
MPTTSRGPGISQSVHPLDTGWTYRVRFLADQYYFVFSTVRQALGPAQHHIQWIPRVKRHGREADHSAPSSAEVKKGGSNLHSPIRLHGIVRNYLSTETTLRQMQPYFSHCATIPLETLALSITSHVINGGAP